MLLKPERKKQNVALREHITEHQQLLTSGKKDEQTL
jgi:hypothetical protein